MHDDIELIRRNLPVCFKCKPLTPHETGIDGIPLWQDRTKEFPHEVLAKVPLGRAVVLEANQVFDLAKSLKQGLTFIGMESEQVIKDIVIRRKDTGLFLWMYHQ